MQEEKIARITACDFCGKASIEVAKLIAGPDISICDACVVKYASAITSASKSDEPREVAGGAVSQQPCSFCGQVEPEVARIVEKNVCICAECLALCLKIIGEDHELSVLRSRRQKQISEQKWTADDIDNGLDYTIRNRLQSRDVFYAFTRLPIAVSAQKEFVEKWRRQLSAALLHDGADKISYAYISTAGNKTTWLVLAESHEEVLEVGFFTKFVLDKMHAAGILLRRSSWYFLEGAIHHRSY
ncbi:MAG: ClpX C4-type zinc finger protein [Candidatus Hydrogenedentes bacterium]|nr:ClpX C4-type zinc finger protein [Candidatus Hydrogenedentota bacterium]